ncbi:MAG: alpha/beta hydrolase, partial [Clostridia bacterium]|nr:alpha/beta hydrolase [Clostridia bacterium]
QSFGKWAKKFKDREWLSADAENNAAYRADKFCGFTCSKKFYADMFKGLKSLYTKKYAKGLRKDMPLLLVSGAQDPVGNMGKGVKKLFKYYKKAGMKNVKMVLFEGSRHEFLNEKKNSERKRRTLLDFFDQN